jgi:hypothetical protein
MLNNTTVGFEVERILASRANVARATLRAHVDSCDACDVGGCPEGARLVKASDDLELELLEMALEDLGPADDFDRNACPGCGGNCQTACR